MTAVALLTACGDAAGEMPATSLPTSSPEVMSATEPPATVAAQGFLFQPDVIEVPAGATVTWENAHTFDAPGTVSFFCTRHLHMRGEVLVR